MARNQSLLLALVVALVAAWGVSCFVAPVESPTAAPKQLRGEAALLGAVVAAAPQVAMAGNSGYALLQLGWAIFIISLGPAVLFWVYFNKPELL
eukprot:CAMPEP_0181441164 /NCGR_PEP_ID=MMETSP1110-20121109/23363_1 /TAXON_ID=174948 /ORGANISM="Symbiodinium sp., Strain CCMP421" /LENGTH=93 /DNA_ID=CAMNT_0023565033 /DNA_START=48 /DNA_END=329 /DNA_ORIENTATION=+